MEDTMKRYLIERHIPAVDRMNAKELKDASPTRKTWCTSTPA
jgi:hypothetical protein